MGGCSSTVVAQNYNYVLVPRERLEMLFSSHGFEATMDRNNAPTKLPRLHHTVVIENYLL